MKSLFSGKLTKSIFTPTPKITIKSPQFLRGRGGSGHKLLVWGFILSLFLLSANGFLQAATSPDAFGFRVMPNPDYLSPLRWYQNNNFKGAPQNLTVDGYEAVRDGRTVYISAANIDLINSKFYSNIYIISYNQDAKDQTIDIFGQILARWKFNTNLSSAGKCSITTNRACAQSSDCAKGEYCSSPKAQAIRDTKRLADLADIKVALANYQAAHGGVYPTLTAGSYLTGKTISTGWPSWQATLGSALGITMPVDPINKLGICDGYNQDTCWDQTNKKFADPTPADTEFNLPADSRAYVYAVKTDGSYQLCAVMESGYITDLTKGACPGSAVGHSVDQQLTPPTISCNASASMSVPFTGYVNLTGANAAKFTDWKVDAISPSSNWSDWYNKGWRWQSATGRLAIDVGAKKVTADITPPAAGNYSYKITVSVPGSSASASAVCEIKIGCTPSCSSAGGNFCRASAPGNSVVGSGACCGGQTCYKCSTGFTWNGTSCVCVKKTKPEACGTKNCGNADDGCGGQYDCGNCASPESCAGGGTTGICGCTPSAPNCAENTCSGVKCNNGCAMVDGTKCCATCNAADQPNCLDSNPGFTEAGVGACCAGQTCYKCAAGFTWDNNTKKCIGCGDGVKNGVEVCDKGSGSPTRTQICSVLFPTGCGQVSVLGTQICNDKCDGWNSCLASAPVSEDHTSTECGSTNAAMTDYACCELTKCAQDGCGCCGRGAASVPAGYTSVAALNVTWDSSVLLDRNGGCYGTTSCGDTSVCSGSSAPGNDGTAACRVNQSISYNRNWYITTNHSSAFFKCWK